MNNQISVHFRDDAACILYDGPGLMWCLCKRTNSLIYDIWTLTVSG